MDRQAKTFIDIFNSEDGFKSIEIPIIQRDYAQGREDKEVTRIRERFINALYNALTEKSEPVKLDFIYGNITDGKLIPLDGQQRLTTLFLLHWYIAKHEQINEQEYTFLNNFTYKTRFSSQHFCESLVKYAPDFSLNRLSEWITNQNWFMFSWEKDPTIKSMLTMLDTIHSVFRETVGIWGKLNKTYISFYFLPLEEMGLTDSLYIKMNSRGKPLTEFEHFKAEIEKIIKEVSPDLLNEFVHKVDIGWVDTLWKYRGHDDITDDEFMRYYRFVTEIICYQNDIPIIENDLDLAIEVYSVKNQNAAENLKFLFKSFDCWKDLSSIDDLFNEYFSNSYFIKNKVCLYTEDSNLFKQCCDEYGSALNGRRKFTLNNILLLYAVLQYLLNKDKISSDEFIERIRIVRNLVFNSSDEIRESRLKAQLNDVQDVILKLQINLNTLGFNEIQKQEEIDKITWRIANKEMIDVINELEDHFLLLGNISIIGLDNPNLFSVRAKKFRLLFNGSLSYLLISKAMLTIGDYSQLASWRFLFGNENNSTWRELFTQSKQRKNFDKTKEVLLQLIDMLPDNIEEFLNKLLFDYINKSETLKDWRYYFINYPAMRKGNSGVFWCKNDPSREKQNQYEIIMMNTALSLNGKHWDPFLYTIYSDENLKEEFTLEEYGAPLIINKTLQKVRCKNSCWEVFDANDILIQAIEIPQNSGNDTIDRIELFKNEYHKMIHSSEKLWQNISM
jgi:hypothetical protein